MHQNNSRAIICASICTVALLILIHTRLLTLSSPLSCPPAYTYTQPLTQAAPCAPYNAQSKSQAPRYLAAHLADTWYPADPAKLRATLAQLDAQAQQQFGEKINSSQSAKQSPARVIIVPHAGYAYSGVVAAAVYRQLDPTTIKNIVILAPSHQPFQGIALPDFDLYQIPTGALRVNRALVQTLAKKTVPAAARKPLFTYNNMLFENEHSVEIQLPLIHHYLPNATITPLLIGDLSTFGASRASNSAKTKAQEYFSELAIKQVAQLLAPHITDSTLLVISSDFTHYGPRFDYTPFSKYRRNQEQLRIKQLDGQAVQALAHQSLAEFLAYLARTRNTICGALPLAILLSLLEQGALKDTQMRLLAYQTSATKNALTQDQDSKFDSNSVSYVGAVFATKAQSPEQAPNKPLFTPYEKTELLKTARATLSNIFAKNIPEELLYPIKAAALTIQTGAFVTLYKNGKLRGCIGRTSSQEPLYKTVIAMTRAAALEDSRFSPVTKQELADIKISISVLTEPTPISHYNDIVLGKHGIILTQKSRSALFLPAVATDQGWDLSTALSELSLKAGLPADAWADPKSTYQVFESIDFSE